MEAFTLSNEPKQAKFTKAPEVVARRLVELPSWTKKNFSLAEKIEYMLWNAGEDEELAHQLESQMKEWKKIAWCHIFSDGIVIPVAPQEAARRTPKRRYVPSVAKPAPKPVEVAKPVVVDPKPVAEKGKRGRPTKYDHIDWVSIAARSQAGEGRRPLAQELGCPPTVVWTMVRKILGTV